MGSGTTRWNSRPTRSGRQAGFTGTLENRAGTNKIKKQEIKKGDTVPCTTGMWVDD